MQRWTAEFGSITSQVLETIACAADGVVVAIPHRFDADGQVDRPIARRAPVAVIVGLCAMAVAGCTPNTGYSDSPMSWACLKVKTDADLTSNMHVVEARGLLRTLAKDTELTKPERTYVRSMLTALRDVDDDAKLGDRLDDVTCPL